MSVRLLGQYDAHIAYSQRRVLLSGPDLSVRTVLDRARPATDRPPAAVRRGGSCVATFALAGGGVWLMSSSSTGMYRYRWPERWLIAGTPAYSDHDGVVYLLTFLGHAYLVKVTEGWGHLPAFGLSCAVYVGMFIAFAIFNGVVIRGLLRIQLVDRRWPINAIFYRRVLQLHVICLQRLSLVLPPALAKAS